MKGERESNRIKERGKEGGERKGIKVRGSKREKEGVREEGEKEGGRREEREQYYM